MAYNAKSDISGTVSSFNYRKEITINHSGALTSYQMKLTVDHVNTNMKTDFGDIRFNTDTGNYITYWIEKKVNNVSADIWIKADLANGNTTIYMYYGNASLTSESNGTNTFVDFSDFDDLTGWTQQSGTWTTSGSILTFPGYPASGDINALFLRRSSPNPLNTDYIVRSKFKPILGNIDNRVFIVVNGPNPLVKSSVNNIIDFSVSGGNGDALLHDEWGTVTSSVATHTTGNWLLGEIRISDAEDSIKSWDYNSGESTGTHTTTNTKDGGDYWGIMNYFDGASQMDWILIRKYSPTEPTYTIYAEQIPSSMAAEGGTVTEIGGYRIHTFTSSGIFTANKAMNVEYLVVAGGGGGLGGTTGGGGGAGGMLEGTNYPVTPQIYAVTIGMGGIGEYSPTNGENSVFDTITAIGGGSGLNGTGGSGGGGRYGLIPGGAGTPGQGNNGGNGRTGSGGQNSGNGYNSGGGGGKNAVGGNAISTKSGDGGAGKVSSITGTAVTYAGGGGGGADAYRLTGPGIGGVGGGGNGGYFSDGAAGTVNTGGGGGGGSNSASINYFGGSGGSGIVVIRYPLSEDISPANITATSMTITPSETPCRQGVCTVTIVVRWSNSGEIDGPVIPNIKIDNVPQTAHASRNVLAGSYIDETFIISNLPAGTHTICPDPN